MFIDVFLFIVDVDEGALMHFSLFRFSGESLRECTEYLQEDGQNVGCRMFPNLPIKRFDKFYTNLSVGGNLTTCKDYAELKQRGKRMSELKICIKLVH